MGKMTADGASRAAGFSALHELQPHRGGILVVIRHGQPTGRAAAAFFNGLIGFFRYLEPEVRR
jgi:hypothetical protein